MNLEKIKEHHKADTKLDYSVWDTTNIHAECYKDRAWLIEEVEKANPLIWVAWKEFNAIRARDGAPDGVSHDYWNTITELMNKYLGDDAQPWPTDAAKELFGNER